MAGESPSQSLRRLSRKAVGWLGHSWLPRAAWVYVLAASVLLGVSQLLWLWHSWPVREILDAERTIAGAPV